MPLDRPTPIHILAYLDATPTSQVIARHAKRLADLTAAPWEAVHVASPNEGRASRAERERLLEAFRVAESLGARSRTLNGDDPAAELLTYARRQSATHILIAAPSRPIWTEVFRSSMLRRLLDQAGDIVIEICPRENKTLGAMLRDATRPPPLGSPVDYLIAAGFVLLATLFAVPVDRAVPIPNISLIYVLAVIAAAARSGMAVAVFAAVLSSLSYNFFLTQPYYSFEIADPSNVWAVFFFLTIALIVSAIAGRARAQTRIARAQADQSANLETFAHALAGARETTDIAAVTAETASKLLYARAIVLERQDETLAPIGEAPGPEFLGADDMAAAQWALQHQSEAGRGASAVEAAQWLFVPLPGEKGAIGVLGARPFDDPSRLDPEQRRLLDLIADQAGLALDRRRLANAA